MGSIHHKHKGIFMFSPLIKAILKNPTKILFLPWTICYSCLFNFRAEKSKQSNEGAPLTRTTFLDLGGPRLQFLLGSGSLTEAWRRWRPTQSANNRKFLAPPEAAPALCRAFKSDLTFTHLKPDVNHFSCTMERCQTFMRIRSTFGFICAKISAKRSPDV